MSHGEQKPSTASEDIPRTSDLRSCLSPLLIDFLQTVNEELDSQMVTESVFTN